MSQKARRVESVITTPKERGVNTEHKKRGRKTSNDEAQSAWREGKIPRKESRKREERA